MRNISKFAGLLLAVSIPGTAVLAQNGAQQDSTLEAAGNKVTEPFDGKEVPQKLLDIQDDPYSLDGLRGCAAIIAEVRELNAVLGPDVNETVDKSLGKKREETAARVAGSAIGSIIPFGGIIGEVTGANAERRRYNIAIYAGTVRRGFLKGVGLQRGCKAPARP
jgi:ribosomal protein S6E (S10)